MGSAASNSGKKCSKGGDHEAAAPVGGPDRGDCGPAGARPARGEGPGIRGLSIGGTGLAGSWPRAGAESGRPGSHLLSRFRKRVRSDLPDRLQRYRQDDLPLFPPGEPLRSGRSGLPHPVSRLLLLVRGRRSGHGVLLHRGVSRALRFLCVRPIPAYGVLGPELRGGPGLWRPLPGHGRVRGCIGTGLGIRGLRPGFHRLPRGQSLRVSPVSVLRLPRLPALPGLESLRILLPELSGGDLQRSVLLPGDEIPRNAGRLRPTQAGRCPVRVQGESSGRARDSPGGGSEHPGREPARGRGGRGAAGGATHRYARGGQPCRRDRSSHRSGGPGPAGRGGHVDPPPGGNRARHGHAALQADGGPSGTGWGGGGQSPPCYPPGSGRHIPTARAREEAPWKRIQCYTASHRDPPSNVRDATHHGRRWLRGCGDPTHHGRR